ncbi:50S ribosomal protein L29 [Patescibacteria group bacterium]
MKLKDKQLLKAKSVTELQADLNNSVEELVKLRLDLKTNKLKDTSQVGKLKNKIAIIKTFIGQQQKEVKK